MSEATGPGEVFSHFRQDAITRLAQVVFHLNYDLLQLLRTAGICLHSSLIVGVCIELQSSLC